MEGDEGSGLGKEISLTQAQYRGPGSSMKFSKRDLEGGEPASAHHLLWAPASSLSPSRPPLPDFSKGLLLVPAASFSSPAPARPVVPPGGQVWDGRTCDNQDSEEELRGLCCPLPTTCALLELQAFPLVGPTALTAFRPPQPLSGVGELGLLDLQLGCERFRNTSTGVWSNVGSSQRHTGGGSRMISMVHIRNWAQGSEI